MAIILEANYSKKLGLPGYSSHQYAVTVRTELETSIKWTKRASGSTHSSSPVWTGRFSRRVNPTWRTGG